MYSVKETARKIHVQPRATRCFDAHCEIPERRSECKEPDRNHDTSEVRERLPQTSDWAGQAITCRSTSGGVVQWGNSTLTAWSRTQQTVSLSSAEAELYALTTGVAEGMVTKHLLQEVRHEVILMNQGTQKRTWKKETHVMLKSMYVQDVVEKKWTNLAYINMKQNKADLMTKCHTSKAHERGSAMIGLRLA